MFGHMAFREVAVTAIREVLRAWRAGAVEAGQARDGGVAQLASIIHAATGPVHHLDTTLMPTKAS